MTSDTFRAARMGVAGIVTLSSIVIACFRKSPRAIAQEGFGPASILIMLITLFNAGFGIYGMILIYHYGPDNSPCPDPLQPLAWYCVTISLISLVGLCLLFACWFVCIALPGTRFN